MGNSGSSGRQHDDSVDYGSLHPHGVHSAVPDWNHSIVTQLIIERRLAPFYQPLEDYEASWDDEQILAARKEFPQPEADAASSESFHRVDTNAQPPKHPGKRPTSVVKDGIRWFPEANAYRGAVECPICFLYYPPNINHSRCCDQAICTECFVSMKRAEPTPQHLVSEPAACPYCVQENFGVTYRPPHWRAGIGSEGYPSMPMPGSTRHSSQQSIESGKAASARTRRRRSFGADSAEVVTIDHIRPDWESKLAAVKAAVARRANRRIIMRQVGDRLIPVGVTSGRVHALTGEGGNEPGEGASEPSGEGRGSRRSRRRQQQQQELNQLLGNLTYGGQELEELMVMEAMRLSLVEHEEQQRREAEERKKKEKEAAKEQVQDSSAHGAGPSNAALPVTPTTAPISIIRRDVDSRPSSEGTSSSVPSGQVGTPESGRLAPERRALTPSAPSSPLATSAENSAKDESPLPPSGQVSEDAHASAPSSTLHTDHERNDSPEATQPPTATTSTPTSSTLNANSSNGLEPHNTQNTVEHETPSPHVPDTPSGSREQGSLDLKKPQRPTIDPTRQFSVSSSLFTPGTDEITHSSVTAYDTLPSSPDSTISHEPLLHDTPAVENAVLRTSD